MSNRYKEAKKLFEEGRYYDESYSWYFYKFAFPFLQPPVLLIALIMLIFAAYIGVNAYTLTFSTQYVPFPIYSKDQVKFLPFIKPLAQGNEPIDRSISRYFVKRYVGLIENYDPTAFAGDDLNETMLAVESISTKRMFDIYKKYMDPQENVNSPVIIYRNRSTRNISINSIQLKESNGEFYKAVVNYTATLKTPGKKEEVVTTNWVSEVEFIMSNVERVYELDEEFYFLVTKYHSYELSK